MNTSSEALRLLQQAASETQQAINIIDNLVVEHDFQDVASLVAQAASALLNSAQQLMQSNDVAAFEAMENAEDLLDAVYDIIDAETDEE
ncbi:MAG: hypothetical protein UZ15_CFX003001920 [Chloroflexi bacterium OLB15]|nr:MAG: hypothetical protein UZ15_CFX003001920 [Chloroflexi bacterium OLB15]